MKGFSFHEFKPTILFLVKFVALYIIGNVAYGFFVRAYHPRPDPVTHIVTTQTGWVLKHFVDDITTFDRSQSPTTALCYQGTAVLEVFEGCNGINTMIIFIAFVLAFGPLARSVLWFIPLGILIIHLMNLVRVALLFEVARSFPQMMYFTHKFLFTAFLYLIIFILWIWWVKKFSLVQKKRA